VTYQKSLIRGAWRLLPVPVIAGLAFGGAAGLFIVTLAFWWQP